MESYVEGGGQSEQDTVTVEYRFENCGEGYGAPDDFVEVTTIIARDEGLIKKRIIKFGPLHLGLREDHCYLL